MPEGGVEARLEAVSGEVFELALATSLAVKVDPVLLRRVRIELVPAADAGTEADLWFSGLVRFRADDGFVLRPDVLDRLREIISRPERRALFDASRRIVRECHRHLGFLLRKEEQLIWMALAGKSDEDIQHELARLLNSMALESPGIAAWARRAVQGMPERVSNLPVAGAIRTAADMFEYPDISSIPVGDLRGDWRSWLPIRSDEPVTVGLRLYADALEISEPPMGGSTTVVVPDTLSLLFEASWNELQTRTHRLVRLDRGGTVRIDGVGEDLQLRARQGSWRLESLLEAAQAEGAEAPAEMEQDDVGAGPARRTIERGSPEYLVAVGDALNAVALQFHVAFRDSLQVDREEYHRLADPKGSLSFEQFEVFRQHNEALYGRTIEDLAEPGWVNPLAGREDVLPMGDAVALSEFCDLWLGQARRVWSEDPTARESDSMRVWIGQDRERIPPQLLAESGLVWPEGSSSIEGPTEAFAYRLDAVRQFLSERLTAYDEQPYWAAQPADPDYEEVLGALRLVSAIIDERFERPSPLRGVGGGLVEWLDPYWRGYRDEFAEAGVPGFDRSQDLYEFLGAHTGLLKRMLVELRSVAAGVTSEIHVRPDSAPIVVEHLPEIRFEERYSGQSIVTAEVTYGQLMELFEWAAAEFDRHASDRAADRTPSDSEPSPTHPGVYVEEVVGVTEPVEGVPTAIAGFVGPARFGPTHGARRVTSFEGFEREFGGTEPLEHAPNFMAHSVHGFFDNGGRELYVARIYRPAGERDGRARGVIAEGSWGSATWEARWPGTAGNVTVRLSIEGDPEAPLSKAEKDDIVLVTDPATGEAVLHRIGSEDDEDASVEPRFPPDTMASVLRARVEVVESALGGTWVESGLALHPTRPDSLSARFSSEHRVDPRPLVFRADGWDDGAAFVGALHYSVGVTGPRGGTSVETGLAGGSDGEPPGADDYVGHPAQDDTVGDQATGLRALAVDDISIVATPGSSTPKDAAAIVHAMITHCEEVGGRIGLIDPRPDAGLEDVRSLRASVKTSRAALYYPWLLRFDEHLGYDIEVPPSGFVAGVYARNDVERGVHKAPANLELRGIVGFEREVTAAEQETLNPENINVLRDIEGRPRVWGSRTLSDDPEWRYVHVRRYLDYIEKSIDRGTQWTVFEPNGPELWSSVRKQISDFLQAEFQSGRLQGRSPEDAYFVRVDDTTTTPTDMELGRLNIEIGVALVKPAEFIIIRFGHQSLGAATEPGGTDEREGRKALEKFTFVVDLGDSEKPPPHAGFDRVSQLGTDPEALEFRQEAGERITKMAGTSKPPDLTLERGLADADVLVGWFQADEGSPGHRRDITISVRDEAGVRAAAWRVFGAWIRKAQWGDLDDAVDLIAVEALGVAFDRIERL